MDDLALGKGSTGAAVTAYFELACKHKNIRTLLYVCIALHIDTDHIQDGTRNYFEITIKALYILVTGIVIAWGPGSWQHSLHLK